MGSLNNLPEEILSLVSKKQKVEIREIKDRFNITSETAKSVIDFLVEFGFVQFDESKGYVMLSKSYKRFLEEK